MDTVLILLVGLGSLAGWVYLRQGLRQVQAALAVEAASRGILAERVGVLERRDPAAPPRAGSALPRAVEAEAGVPAAEALASRVRERGSVAREAVAAPDLPPPRLTSPPAPPRPAPVPTWVGTPLPAPARASSIDWEQFMGVRLFAWLGGLALFLGMAYLVKYSFDRDLVPPGLRVLTGMLVGAGLIGGGLRFGQRAYAVLSQTLCATGVVILYAALYAGQAFYHLAWLPQPVVFLGMVLVTALALGLALRMSAQVVAVLGWVGGFLTPILVGSGGDQTLLLFLYIGLLDLGLLVVALRRRWDYLALLGALGTLMMQGLWALQRLDWDQLGVPWMIVTAFLAQFTGAWVLARRNDTTGEWWSGSVAVLAAGVFLGVGILNGRSMAGEHPGWLFAAALSAQVALLVVSAFPGRNRWLGLGGSVACLMLLALWQMIHLTPERLWWALGLALVFALVPMAVVALQARRTPGEQDEGMVWMAPAAGLVLLVPVLKLPAVSLALWPTLFLVNLLSLLVAGRRGGLAGVVTSMVITGVATTLFTAHQPWRGGTAVELILAVILAGSVVFVVGGLWLLRPGRPGFDPGRPRTVFEQQLDSLGGVPVLATLMPFLLLGQLVVLLRPEDPSSVFAALAVMTVLLLGLAAWLRQEVLPLVGWVASAVVQHLWLSAGVEACPAPAKVVVFALLFWAFFAAYPLVARTPNLTSRIPWAVAALAGVSQFHVLYRIVDHHWPNGFMGLLPLACAVVPGAMVAWLAAQPDDPQGFRRSRLAWFGGVTLFFLTVALPIQFERHWLTVGWALEGAALLALYRRLPHRGLLATGAALLVAVAIRLLLNPAVMDQEVRGPWPLWNRWLYTYGVAVLACGLGAWSLRERPDLLVRGLRVRPLVVTLGTVLGFALVNLQIADFFTPVGQAVRFEFSGDFGRDMTYTISWALFALGLVAVGLVRSLRAARWSGLALLAVALAKLFLHDLARLDQLYRVGALIGVALVAITASFLYQRTIGRAARLADPAASPTAGGGESGPS